MYVKSSHIPASGAAHCWPNSLLALQNSSLIVSPLPPWTEISIKFNNCVKIATTISHITHCTTHYFLVRDHGVVGVSINTLWPGESANGLVKQTTGRTGIRPFMVHFTHQQMPVTTDFHCWDVQALAIIDWLFTPSFSSSSTGEKITLFSSRGLKVESTVKTL